MIYKLFQNYFQGCLERHKQPQEYLKSRGISIDNSLRFEVGYAPPIGIFNRWINTVAIGKLGITKKDLMDAKVIYEDTKNPTVYKMLTFPVYGFDDHNIVGFSTRSIYDKKHKRLGHMKFPLYNIPLIQMNPQEIFLCEGEIDTLTLLSYNLPAVGNLGLQATYKSIHILASVPRIYICFDPDLMGIKEAQSVGEILNGLGSEVYIVDLPHEENCPEKYDINKFIQIFGYTAFLKRVQEARIVKKKKFLKSHKNRPKRKDPKQPIHLKDFIHKYSSYRLKKEAGDKYRMTCPYDEHPDDKASFVIFPDGKGWCFGCGVLVDAPKFARDILGWKYDEIKKLCYKKEGLTTN